MIKPVLKCNSSEVNWFADELVILLAIELVTPRHLLNKPATI
jgi:hypothetical protein